MYSELLEAFAITIGKLGVTAAEFAENVERLFKELRRAEELNEILSRKKQRHSLQKTMLTGYKGEVRYKEPYQRYPKGVHKARSTLKRPKNRKRS